MKIYNLSYMSKKTGMKILGRKPNPLIRKIELSNGKKFSASWASKNLEYLGGYEESGNFIPYEKPHFETHVTPNGFKIVKQMSK